MKHVKSLPYILAIKKPLVVSDGVFLYLCYYSHNGMNQFKTAEEVDLIQNTVHCQTPLDRAANSIKVRELLAHCVTTSFSRIMLHPVSYIHTGPGLFFTFI